MPRRMRGISPVIATVIILAVTIAIAIAVVGWVMGLFRSSTKGSAQLELYPNSTVYDNGTGFLWIADKGGGSAQITKIKIGDVVFTCDNVKIKTGEVKEVIVAPQGATITANCTAPSASFTPGVTYEVSIYTADGNVFPGNVVAEASS